MVKKLNVRVRPSKDNSTEKMYNKMLMYAEQVHQANKRRIKHGLISLAVIPVVLIFFRYFTDSNRIAFLIIWIACMFVVASFLVYTAYLDKRLQDMLTELSNDELQEFDNLLAVKRNLSLSDFIRTRQEARK